VKGQYVLFGKLSQPVAVMAHDRVAHHISVEYSTRHFEFCGKSFLEFVQQFRTCPAADQN